MGNNYLYADATSADHFGQRRLEYYSYPRLRLKGSMKQSRTGSPLNRYRLQLGKQYGLSLKLFKNQYLVGEPARVIGFTYDERNKFYSQVEFELTNAISPNITRNVVFPLKPEIDTTLNIDSGISSTFIKIQGQLWIEIYLEDQVFKIKEDQTQVSGNNGTYRNTNYLENGRKYFARYYTISEDIKSQKTDFIEFTPAAGVGAYGAGLYGAGFYGIGET